MCSATVVVTGAGGFIGASLVRVLAGRGRSVRALMGPPGSSGHRPPEGVETISAEIDDRQAMGELVDGADAVIHLAGLPSVADSFRRPAEHARVHVAGTATVLEACRRAAVRRVVYLSSAEVYGQPETEPVSETHRLQARSPYAAAKIAAEHFIEAQVRAGAGEAVVLRPFSVYGPQQPNSSLLSTIISQARSGDRVRLVDLQPVRDYCYVDDVSDAIDRAVSVQLAKPFRVFNIGSGRGRSVRELAELTLEALGLTREIVEHGEHDRPARADIRRLIADPGRASRELEWRSGTSLRQGLLTTIRQVSDPEFKTGAGGTA